MAKRSLDFSSVPLPQDPIGKRVNEIDALERTQILQPLYTGEAVHTVSRVTVPQGDENPL
jgi:hypothetical protein